MDILIIGAASTIGGYLLSEATSRKHTVVCGLNQDDNTQVTSTHTNVLSLTERDVCEISILAKRTDVVISAVSPSNYGTVISDSEHFSRTLVKIAVHTGKRMVIAGCGSSSLANERTHLPTQSRQHMMPEATVMRSACAMFSSANINFTVMEPGGEVAPSETISSHHIGSRTIRAGSNDSRGVISARDFAVAMLNEVESPTLSSPKLGGYHQPQ